jgi:hypothetical protein
MAVQIAAVSATTQSTVKVLATTVDGTRAALASAIPLAAGSHARLVVAVPRIVPYPIAIDGPVDTASVLARRIEDMVRELGGSARVDVCLCRRLDDVVAHLGTDGTIVVGGRPGHWLMSAEERLARRLCRLGRHVVFVASAPGTPASGRQ